MTSFLTKSLKMHRDSVLSHSENTEFTVFLCGPAINKSAASHRDPAARLRAKIKCELENNGFTVVLGEDEGLDDTRIKIGSDAQDNELQYISEHCNAVIIVTGNKSIGAFCELGLFSWHFAHRDGKINKRLSEMDFILLVNKKFKNQRSYFNEGPASIVSAFGLTQFIDYSNYDIKQITKRLKLRKSMLSPNRRS